MRAFRVEPHNKRLPHAIVSAGLVRTSEKRVPFQEVPWIPCKSQHLVAMRFLQRGRLRPSVFSTSLLSQEYRASQEGECFFVS